MCGTTPGASLCVAQPAGRNGYGKSTLLRSMATRALVGFPARVRVLLVAQEAAGDERSALQVGAARAGRAAGRLAGAGRVTPLPGKPLLEAGGPEWVLNRPTGQGRGPQESTRPQDAQPRKRQVDLNPAWLCRA